MKNNQNNNLNNPPDFLEEKPTIMHLIDSLNIGGAERMLVEIANHTDDKNFKVVICVTRSDNQYVSSIKPDIPIHFLKRISKFDLSGITRFKKILKYQSIDILHVHGRSTLSFIFLMKMLKVIKAPILFHDHNGMIEIDQSIPLWFKIFGKHYLAYYIGVCPKLAEWAYKAGIPKNRISVIENALDISYVKSAEKLLPLTKHNHSNKKLTGIFVGGLRPQKGLDLLIVAVNDNPRNREAVYWIVGKEQDLEYVNNCKLLINEFNLNNDFVFLGERTDVIDLMQKAEFAVIPSISESGPLVLIEFLANGLPIVASKTGSISLKADSLGVPGFVAPGSIEEFSRELRSLLCLTESERILRSKIGVEVIKKHFSIQTRMSDWNLVYQSILRDNPCGY